MTVELRKAVTVSPAELSFDLSNPRLAHLSKSQPLRADKDIILALKSVADLDELILSIAANGYVNVEPMLVIGEDAPYRVLEGNRRLAAIKLFLDPDLAESCKVRIPEIDPLVVESLKNILVYRIESEDESRAYIGFKHINGPHKWDSLAKAKYAADWYQGGVSIEEISQKIGDSFQTVKKMLFGWFVLEQAKSENVFTPEDAFGKKQFAFSHLYVALTRTQIREFLGISGGEGESLVSGPISQERIENLGKLCRWIYGSKQDRIEPVVRSQNPDIKNLAEVLANERALHILEVKEDLNAAHQSLVADDAIFKNALFQAELNLKQALANSYTYINNDAQLSVAGSIKRMATELLRSMESKRQGSEE